MELPLPGTYLIVSRLPRAGERVRLPREEATHARARRLSRGDAVVLLDGSGAQGEGVLARLDRSGGEVEVDRIRTTPESGPRIALFVAGVRAQRLSWIAEKATELGAVRLVIVSADRTQAFRAAAPVLLRLERVVREAAKQCGNPRWPQVSGPVSLVEVLRRERSSHRFFCDREGDPFPSRLTLAPAALLLGPEGGWTDEERQTARAVGWSAVAIPAGKLRTETAAVAALVLLRAALSRKA